MTCPRSLRGGQSGNQGTESTIEPQRPTIYASVIVCLFANLFLRCSVYLSIHLSSWRFFHSSFTIDAPPPHSIDCMRDVIHSSSSSSSSGSQSSDNFRLNARHSTR